MQGYARVGRYTDICKRMRFADVDEVDRKKELIYTRRLFEFMRQMQTKPIVCKAIAVKPVESLRTTG